MLKPSVPNPHTPSLRDIIVSKFIEKQECGATVTSQCVANATDATVSASVSALADTTEETKRHVTRFTASGRQTLGLCPDLELSVLAPPKLHDRAIADLDADESNQRQIQADKLAKSNSVIFVSMIKQGRQTRKYSKRSHRLGGSSLHELRRQKARDARLAKKNRTRTRRNQRDLKSEMLNNSLTDDSPKSVSKVELKETFDTTLSVINSPWNHAMPFLHRLHPFSRAIDDNKSSKGYMLLMRTYARNIGAEFNADYLSHTYWLQSNPEGMTHAAFFDYPYQAMYGWIYDASRDVNTDLLLKFQDRQCPICLEKIAMNCYIKGCNGEGGKRHLFHAKCLDSWIEKGNRDCPSCRGELFFPVYPHDPVLDGPHCEEIWTWFPCSYRFAEEPAEEPETDSKSEPVETIQLCLARIAHETNDQGLKNLLGMPDDDVVYSAYYDYLEDRDWGKFKNTCRHFLQDSRAEDERNHLAYLDHLANVNGEYYETDDETYSAEEEDRSWGDTTNPYEDRLVPAQSEPAQHAEPAENVIIPLEERTNSMSRRHVEYLDHEAYVNGENDSDDDPWDDMTEEEWLIGTRLSTPTTAEEHEETPEGSGEPAQSEPAIASRGCGIRLPRGSERQRVPYEGWSGGTCGVGDILCFNCAQNNAPEGSERVESEARSSFWDDENNWTDDFVPSMRSIAERYDWDDYETDPEDKAADLYDY